MILNSQLILVSHTFVIQLYMGLQIPRYPLMAVKTKVDLNGSVICWIKGGLVYMYVIITLTHTCMYIMYSRHFTCIHFKIWIKILHTALLQISVHTISIQSQEASHDKSFRTCGWCGFVTMNTYQNDSQGLELGVPGQQVPCTHGSAHALWQIQGTQLHAVVEHTSVLRFKQ